MAWCVRGWCLSTWTGTDEVLTPPPQPLPTVVLTPVTLTMLPRAYARLTASVVATPDILQIPHIRPRGPYGTEVIIGLNTAAGLRIFGFQVVSEMVQTSDIGRYSTLLAVDPIEFGPGGRTGTVLGHLGVLMDPRGRATFWNLDGFWSRLWATEVLLTMPVGEYLYTGAWPLVTIFVGLASRMVLKKSMFTLEWSPGNTFMETN